MATTAKQSNSKVKPTYGRGLSPHEVVAPEVYDTWVDFKKDQSRDDLRNELVEHYLPLVKYNAERIWHRVPKGVELDDLFSAGVFGLMGAIDAFKLDRGVKFETYCMVRLRGSILDELRHMDWVPRMVRNKATKLRDATSRLQVELGRLPTEQELADHMDMSLADMEQLIVKSSSLRLTSLDKQKWQESDGNKSLREIDTVSDQRSDSPEKRSLKNDVIRLVTKGLSRPERMIMILYYYEQMTMKEIGATLDLSESRVSQMHSSIVERLQLQLADRQTEMAC